MADFPKKQQQCLIPKYLLDYLGRLDENHPDPSAEWGGQGAEYTAGTGIVIENDEISVDTETIPTVSELSTVAFSGSYLNLSDTPDLSVYQLEENAFKVLDFSSYYGAQTSPELWEALEDTWPRVIVKYYDNYFVPETDSLPYNSEYRLTCIHATHHQDIQTQKEIYDISVNNLQINEYSAFQDMPVTVTNDYDDLVNQPTIPVVPTNVSAFNNDADYATETYVDNAAADAFKVLDFSQYSGQSDLFAELQAAWPKVFVLYYGYMYMPMTFEQYEPSYTFIHVDGQYNPIDPQNPANDINLNRIQINQYFVFQYNCIISNDYNDLINKPTMPAAVSGTNDGTNWTTITIGTDTYSIPSGGGSSYTAGTGIDITNDVISIDNTVALKTDIPTVPTNVSAFTNDAGYITSSDLPTNHVTTDTAQTITGAKTFTAAMDVVNTEKGIKLHSGTNNSTNSKLGFTLFNSTAGSSSNEVGFLEGNTQSKDVMLGFYNTNGRNDTNYRDWKVGFAYYGYTGTTSSSYSAYKLALPNKYNLQNYNTYRYIPIDFTNGTTTVRADETGIVNISTLLPTVPTKTSDLNNDSGFITSSALTGYATETWVGNQGYITGITSSDVTTALGYTPGTSNFSGSYNDLTNKPSIPSTASSTSTVTPSTSAFVTGTSTTTETLTFTYTDNTTANITIVTSVTDSTSNAMTGATVSTSTTLS